MAEITLTLPSPFSFMNQQVYDFDRFLSWFRWDLYGDNVTIDMNHCTNANYQALAMLIPYVWHLRAKKCRIDFLNDNSEGASRMWKTMGARGWSNVLSTENVNFKGHQSKPLIAIRNQRDFAEALTRAESYTNGFNVEYEKTLRYVISELLYNTLEHGRSHYNYSGQKHILPSIMQFAWYQRKNEIHFIISDLGIGIKKHLEQAYPIFEDDVEAIKFSIRPGVSGTFGTSDPYKSKDNAGAGLFLSSNIVRKLKADMHILSHNGLVHISPRDITSKTLQNAWPGTFVLVTLKLEEHHIFTLHTMMSEFRDSAQRELAEKTGVSDEGSHYLNVQNLFGPYAEDKLAAINYREKRLIPAIISGQTLKIDFNDVISAPHSFLSALLATPIRRIGATAYKKIKIINAVPEIRETIDYIFDENTD